jgi:Ca2+-binding EF-hand superfamily protein
MLTSKLRKSLWNMGKKISVQELKKILMEYMKTQDG